MIALLVLVFGLVIGSFLNVCIYRLPRRESVTWPASHCTSCNRVLSWYENIPLASWLVLRGRCRACKQPFSARHHQFKPIRRKPAGIDALRIHCHQPVADLLGALTIAVGHHEPNLRDA